MTVSGRSIGSCTKVGTSSRGTGNGYFWYPFDADFDSDGTCDEDEEGYDAELNEDPSNDNWGSDNLNGTEENGTWDEGEGREGNGVYDDGEPYYDWGIDGIPEQDEASCFDCIDDLDNISHETYYLINMNSISYKK